MALIALMLLPGLVGCQSEGADAKPGTVQAKGDDQGAAVRRRLVAESGGLYKNAEVSEELAGIGERLSAVSGGEPVSVLVLNSATPNAYFLPGGHIYLTRELLTMARDESELAAVIAHEMAHILSNHAEERDNLRIKTALSSDQIAAVLSDSERMRALLLQSDERVAALSRQQELEADALAIRLLAKAGYDPAAVGRFLKTMQASTGVPGASGYTSSHPLPSLRIMQAERLAAKYSYPGNGTTGE